MTVPTRASAGRLLSLGVVLDADVSNDRAAAPLLDRAGIDTVWLVGASAAEAATQMSSQLQRARLGVVVDAGPVPGDADVVEVAPGVVASVGLPTVATRLAQGEAVASGADDVRLLPGGTLDVMARIAELRQAGYRGGIALDLLVSVGRTAAEATARLTLDTRRDPHREGWPPIVARLEDAQDRVLVLAHAGVTELRCRLPMTPDLPDLVAQLPALVVGTLDRLRPGSPRSAAPPPPAGWGGPPKLM